MAPSLGSLLEGPSVHSCTLHTEPWEWAFFLLAFGKKKRVKEGTLVREAESPGTGALLCIQPLTGRP
jgi:hypothetical protein